MATAFGKRLRELRTQAGKTMGELARELHVSVAYVSDVERGNRAPFKREQVLQIATFLGIESDQLLIDAAASRGSFTLSSEVEKRGAEVGAALMRGWSNFSDEDFGKLLETIKSLRGHDGNQ
jgi:transcriptional regulator with XRE-family HTH domain